MSVFSSQVKGRVDDFKEHLQLIQALFNPGVRGQAERVSRAGPQTK